MSTIEPFTVGAVALPTDPSVQMSSLLPQANSQRLYQVTIDEQGTLTATVEATDSGTLLSLEDSQGNVLIQSEGNSPTNPDDQISQNLPAGDYLLSISNSSTSTDFRLTTNFTPALAPGQAISESQGAYAVSTADLTNNGKADLIVPDYNHDQILINYGLGNGTFQSPVAIPVGRGPTDVVAADLFGDGEQDIVVVDQLSNDLMILRGDGQGNFSVDQVLPTRPGPVRVVAGDFSGDGRLDLAVADEASNGVEIFHNLGNGQFTEANWIGSIATPSSLTTADLGSTNGDDLAVTSSQSGNIVLLNGLGNDQFVSSNYQLPVGPGASDVISANFDGSKLSELAAVSPEAGTISIFRYDGFAYRLETKLKAGSNPRTLVAADFNGDGNLDLAAVNTVSNTVSIFLGKGNDTFASPISYATGTGPVGLASADFTGDGLPDLVTTDLIDLTVSVLINKGDATFISPPQKPPSAGPLNVIEADLTNNGIDDLIVPDSGLHAIEIFLGRGDGTFREPILVPTGASPYDVAVGDFTGDGIPDMAVVDYENNTLMIFKGIGDGTFDPIETLPTGDGPEIIKTADLDGAGHLDLVVADFLGNNINIFYGNGDGTFESAVSYSTGLSPSSIAISDLNGDGRPDLAIADSGSDDVEVMMATGSRTYAPPVAYPIGEQPWSISVGDFNDDGHPDLIVSDGPSATSSVSLLLNNGEGRFQPAVNFGVGGSDYPLAIGDFTGTGNLDVVVGNDVTNELGILIGRGNGTFEPELQIPAGIDPYGIALGDFNGDGKLDIAEVNFQSSNVIIDFGDGDGTVSNPETIPLISPDLPTITADLEGNGVPQVLVADPVNGTINVFNSQGDGTLQLINTIDVGGSPSGMVVGDFNGDGRPDLAVTDAKSGEVLIFLGLGNGTFEGPVRYKVGQYPQSPIVADFKNNGILDIAVADTNSNEVSVLYGNGNGTFQPAINYPTGLEPTLMQTGYANDDDFVDFGVVDRSSQEFTEFLGTPQGGFDPVTVKLPGVTPTDLLIGDFTSQQTLGLIILDDVHGMIYIDPDYASASSQLLAVPIAPGNYLATVADLYKTGESDLILANTSTNVVTIYRGWVGNHFQSQTSFQADVSVAGISAVDLNHDGFPDIVITEAGTGNVETYLSGGDGTFSAAESMVPLPRPAPLIFRLGTPGLSNIVSTDENGQVLERLGIAGTTAEFKEPINQTLGTNLASRDYAIVRTGGVELVALLTTAEPLVVLQNTVNVTASGRTSFNLPDDGIYTRLISGDLFGTGLDAIVVINQTLNEVLVFEQMTSGVFRQFGDAIPSGFGPTDISLADLTPGGLPDLVVTDGSTGTVTLIGRTAGGGFYDEATLEAGLSAAGTVALPTGLERTSPDEPVGVTSGVFDASGPTDVVVVDYGTDRISILPGLPDGGLGAPTSALTYSTGLDPIEVVAAPLTKNGLLDLIVLNEGSDDLSIFLNNGHGGFTVMPRVDAGDNPTSFSVSDVTGDGIPDIIVGNTSGDILILAGNGDGTFQPYERADATVSLAVGDLSGNGQNDFVLTNTAEDLLSVQTSLTTTGFVQGRGNGLLAPGPVAIADMNDDGIADLIVTNSGGNDVLVYLGLGGGRFAAPQEFFTGTDPVGLTVAKLTSNGLPDLIVANAGSNDVTILLGTIDKNGDWTMVPGPRLKAGDRPVATTVADLFGNGQQDILVVDQDGNAITVLPGLGGGFFDDNNPWILATGDSPVEAFVGHFSSSKEPGIVILNSGSNDMTFYANISAAPVTISSDGIDPVAGVTGYFNRDGFEDLAVANNGDSRISLFDGSPNGLYLSQTILLGASTRPTDLVVTRTKGVGIQFYVGAEGQDHAIAVTVNSEVTIVTIGPTTGDDSLGDSTGTARSTVTASTTSNGLSATLFEPMTYVAGTQTQETATSSATSSATSAGPAGLASAVVATIASAIQPLFAPSARAIGWLYDNLVHLEQGQTVDVLPLGKNEMAAVAVLLSGSNLGSPVEPRGVPTSPVPTENDPAKIVSDIFDDTLVVAPSSLDRFVANLGSSSLDFSDIVSTRPAHRPDFGSEWVWRRQQSDPTELTVRFESATEFDPIARQFDRDTLVPDASIEAVAALTPTDHPAETLEAASLSFLGKSALIVGSGLILTLGIVLIRQGPRRMMIDLWNRRSQPRKVEPKPPDRTLRLADRSIFATSQGKLRQDLPPWLMQPMTLNRRNHFSNNGLASIFKKSRLRR